MPPARAEQRIESLPSERDSAPFDARTPERRRRYLRYGLLGLLLVAGLALFGWWLMDRWAHVYVVDSRVAAHVVAVSSEVAGRVIALPVVAGEEVAEGDLLVRLESREAQLELERIAAQLNRVAAEQDRLRAEQDTIRAQVDSRLAAARAQITAAKATHGASEAALQVARSEFERARSLQEKGIVPMQRLDEARSTFLAAEQRERRGAADVEAAVANLAVIDAERTRIKVLDRQIAVLDAEKAALETERAAQQIDLEDRELRAAFDGVVDATFIEVGEYVSPGTRLVMYHDPQNVWVEANVKETAFRKLRIGAPAVITVDAYPDVRFEGKVVRLGHAATSQFALLPSPNPSGNFTKVTQRLPVRISIAQQDGLLRPGMMVEVAIDAVD